MAPGIPTTTRHFEPVKSQRVMKGVLPDKRYQPFPLNISNNTKKEFLISTPPGKVAALSLLDGAAPEAENVLNERA